MLRVFMWPNYKNREGLAKEFFDKAKNGIDSLNLPYQSSICLCSDGNGTFILVLIECSDDNSDMHNAIKEYFVKCGCPKWQLIEGLHLGEDVTIDNLGQRAARAGITILDDISSEVQSSTKRWWEFWKKAEVDAPDYWRDRYGDEIARAIKHFEGGRTKKWWEFWK